MKNLEVNAAGGWSASQGVLVIALCHLLWSNYGIAQEDGWKPESIPLSRYSSSWEKNPFNIKTSTAGKQGDFANDLTLSGVSKIGDSTTVLAVNRKTGAYLSLQIGKKDPSGIEVIEIKESGDSREVKVFLRKGEKEGTLTFGNRSASTGAGESATKKKTVDTPSIRAFPVKPQKKKPRLKGFRLPPPADKEGEGEKDAQSKTYAEPLKYGKGRAAENQRRAINALPRSVGQ